jgi:outer membrane biogenesis lipoprotein LolB
MSKLFVLLMASAILMACNNQQQEGHEGHADHQHATESAPVATPAGKPLPATQGWC